MLSLFHFKTGNEILPFQWVSIQRGSGHFLLFMSPHSNLLLSLHFENFFKLHLISSPVTLFHFVSWFWDFNECNFCKLQFLSLPLMSSQPILFYSLHFQASYFLNCILFYHSSFPQCLLHFFFWFQDFISFPEMKCSDLSEDKFSKVWSISLHFLSSHSISFFLLQFEFF